ncbi:helix-turn-helix domain-containing protein [uncultured Roseobacter sp.]|uniref:helix-turn-helix domain-containing protein n=1 Tax=uncultured Roseobacter sp. TaxID=114847 RepID=UPI00262590F3|nr:helix-turn-helix domain-containing protein [uncultured Roseobacter sp.]
MGKRVSTRGIKKHRHYTYEDAACILGLSVQTVRAWKGEGLKVLDQGRPHYILGEALIEFVAKRQQKRTITLAADQFYCFKCRAPKKPFGMMVDYVPINQIRGRLEALCETCERPCQKFSAEASLAALSKVFAIDRRSGSQA